MKHLILAGLALALAGSVAGVATADGHPRKPGHKPMNMERLDTDRDGKVTLDEFAAGSKERVERMFKRMDRDGDGVITAADRLPKGEGHRGRDRHDQKAPPPESAPAEAPAD